LELWECSFCMIYFVRDNTQKFIFRLHRLWHPSMVQTFVGLLMQSMLFLPNLDIKSFNDSHIIHLANIDLLFCTSTLRWCLFLNLLIVDWEIPPMFKSLLIYMHIIMKLKKQKIFSFIHYILLHHFALEDFSTY
jgi:hypothetical protein